MAGVALVGSLPFAIWTAISVMRDSDGLFFTDYEESVEWQMVRDREYPNLRLWMSDVGYGRAVKAHYLDCLAIESHHFQTLRISRGHQGLFVDTSCEPLDFSTVSADKVHPDLVVFPYFTRRDYIATLPGFVPTGDRAIQLETKWNEHVLINYDLLVHLGLVETETAP